jgi:hypothetical protein
MNRRLFACLLVVFFLGAVSPRTVALSPAEPGPGIYAQDIPTKPLDPRAEVRVINQKMRALGFSFSKIERAEGGHIVHVTGFRARTTAFEQRGQFLPFTVRAKVVDGQVVLEKNDLERAGIIIIDSRPIADRGIRIEPIKDIALVSVHPARPSLSTVPGGPATDPSGQIKPPALTSAGPWKVGKFRWAPVAMAPPAPDRDLQPPQLGQSAGIQKAEVLITFDNAMLKVNKRPALPFVQIPMLDPSRERGTPLQPGRTLPPFDSGESMSAEEYYRDFNALEKDFNALGYSLDDERDPAEEVLLQEIPPPSGQNGIGIKMKRDPLVSARLKADGFMNSVKSKQSRLAALKTAKEKMEGAQPTQVKKATRSEVPSATGQKARVTVAPTLGPRERPFSRNLDPPTIEKGDRKKFAITLQSSGQLQGDPRSLKIVNKASAKAYIFNNSVSLFDVTGETYAPVRKDSLAVKLDVMVLGDYVSGAAINRSAPVPDVPLAEMAILPTVGSPANWTSSIDFGYGMTFMIGPIPLSVRIGARAALGVESALLASPVEISNNVTPKAFADVYAQAGINIIIVEAGVECRMRLIDGELTVYGLLRRGAEDGREFLDTECSIHRFYRALDGALSLYAKVYVPRWGLPPWKRKTYRTQLAGWSGFSGDQWEPGLTTTKHVLYSYPGTGLVVAGFTY